MSCRQDSVDDSNFSRKLLDADSELASQSIRNISCLQSMNSSNKRERKKSTIKKNFTENDKRDDNDDISVESDGKEEQKVPLEVERMRLDIKNDSNPPPESDVFRSGNDGNRQLKDS